MATSIRGGATQRPDGTWQDANGNPLDREAAAAAQAHADQLTAQRNAEEAARLAQESRSNPIASALLAALKPTATQEPDAGDDTQTDPAPSTTKRKSS